MTDLDAQLAQHTAIIDFLTTAPSLWDCGDSIAPDISKIETHGATVLLGKSYAVKLKKPVLFDHMDYSSPAKRIAYCKREVTLNKRTAPQLYLAAKPIYQTQANTFCLDKNGDPIEYFVHMRRFPDNNRLDQILATEGLPDLLAEQLCDEISKFHKQAVVYSNLAEIPDFHEVIDQNFKQLDNFCPALFDQKQITNFQQTLHLRYSQLKPLENQRIADTWIRMGHGDLHLQNICLFDQKPVIFDAIEYEDKFAVGDVLYDLSFLLMDLLDQKHPKAANLIFNQYIHQMGWTGSADDLRVLEFMPFFLAMRAGIRCHVAANRFVQSDVPADKDTFKHQAVTYFEAACSYLAPSPPQVIAIGGFSGSGKSTLAANLAPFIGAAPGALRLRSDVIRRLLTGADDYSPMPQSAYTQAQSIAVYAHMRELASAAIKAGQSVIFDAVLDRKEDRQAFEQVAKDINVPFCGLWLSVSHAEMAARITSRKRDASDATVDVLDAQLAANNGPTDDWVTVDANDDQGQVARRARHLIGKHIK